VIFMGKSTRLDRSNWSFLQYSSGVPNASVKGNVYIDNTTGYIWTRKTNSSWALLSSGSSSLWEIGSVLPNTLSPVTGANGLALNCSNPINLATTSSISLSTETAFSIINSNYTSIGEGHSAGPDYSVVFGRNGKAYWPGSIINSSCTFGADYNDNGCHITSAAMYATTNSSFAYLTFFDSDNASSELTIEEGQLLYLKGSILVSAVDYNDWAAYEIYVICHNSQNEDPITIAFSSVVLKAGTGSENINTPIITTSNGNIYITVQSGGATDYRWICTFEGASLKGYIGT